MAAQHRLRCIWLYFCCICRCLIIRQGHLCIWNPLRIDGHVASNCECFIKRTSSSVLFCIPASKCITRAARTSKFFSCIYKTLAAQHRLRRIRKHFCCICRCLVIRQGYFSICCPFCIDSHVFCYYIGCIELFSSSVLFCIPASKRIAGTACDSKIFSCIRKTLAAQHRLRRIRKHFCCICCCLVIRQGYFSICCPFRIDSHVFCYYIGCIELFSSSILFCIPAFKRIAGTARSSKLFSRICKALAAQHRLRRIRKHFCCICRCLVIRQHYFSICCPFRIDSHAFCYYIGCIELFSSSVFFCIPAFKRIAGTARSPKIFSCIRKTLAAQHRLRRIRKHLCCISRCLVIRQHYLIICSPSRINGHAFRDLIFLGESSSTGCFCIPACKRITWTACDSKSFSCIFKTLATQYRFFGIRHDCRCIFCRFIIRQRYFFICCPLRIDGHVFVYCKHFIKLFPASVFFCIPAFKCITWAARTSKYPLYIFKALASQHRLCRIRYDIRSILCRLIIRHHD
ncbi:Uncharacterised protein [Hungatella hathewayi]|nr:Uncharacterised protein [Hungatella hathewayi]